MSRSATAGPTQRLRPNEAYGFTARRSRRGATRHGAIVAGNAGCAPHRTRCWLGACASRSSSTPPSSSNTPATGLFIDPGKFTTPITEAAGAVAVVVTHQHDDHWTPEQIGRIRDRNPEARVFGPEGMAAVAAEAGIDRRDASRLATRSRSARSGCGSSAAGTP